MAWWGVVLIAAVAMAGGYCLGGAKADGKWCDILRQQGHLYHRQIEVLNGKCRRYREAMFRACERATECRVEANRLRAGKERKDEEVKQ